MVKGIHKAMDRIINDIKYQSVYIPRAIVLTPVILFAYQFVIENSRAEIIDKIKSLFKNIWDVLFCFSLSFILISTIIGRWPGNPYKHIFDYFGFIHNGVFSLESIENVVLFIPYTFFFLKARRCDKPLKNSLILSILTTCFIELAQLIFWAGSFQFSDILHNIEGGIIGYVLWILKNKIWRKLSKRK